MKNSIWIWVIALFCLLLGAWFTLIRVAHTHKPEEVPLDSPPSKEAQPNPPS